MQSKEEVVRNRKKLYPAPKSAISTEAFRNAYMRLKAAERRLCQEQNSEQSMLIGAAASYGHRFQSHGHHSGEDNSTGHEAGSQPMETEENAIAPEVEKQQAAQREEAAMMQKEKEEEEKQQKLTQKMRDKEQRKAERQKQQDEEWERSERKRQETFKAKEKAAQKLEEQRKQQGEQLATLRAKVDTLKAQKQDMVEQLKQVLLTEETEKERAARVAALEDGEMLMESPLPGSSTPAYTHSMQPGQQGRPSWPLASPALSPGVSHGSQAPSPALSNACPLRAGNLSASAPSERPQLNIRGSDPKSPHATLPPHLQSL